MGRLLPLVCLLASAGAGCRYGTSAETFPPAQGPEGVTIRITARETGLRGELIEVRSDGLVMRVGGVIWFLDYDSIGSALLEEYSGSFGLGSGRTPEAEDRRGLALLARYPQGLAQDRLDELLRVHAQTRFRTLDFL